MLKIKSFTVAMAFLLLCGNAFAQEGGREQDNTVPKERIVYLWDVTKSTCGFDDRTGIPDSLRNRNICGDIVDMMKKDINSIPNENTEIIVVAYRGGLDKVGYKCSPTYLSDKIGKNGIFRFIEENTPNLKSEGGTNTFAALNFVMKEIVKNDAYNYIKIMTDGRADSNDSDSKNRKNVFEKWNRDALNKKTIAFYLTLTPCANEGKKTIMKELKKLGDIQLKRFHFVNNLEGIMAVRLVTPRDSVVEFNVIENKSLKVNFNVALGDCKIADGFKMHCEANASFGDAYFKINEDVLLKEYGNGYCIELTPEMSDFIQHKFDSFGYDGCIDLRFAPAGDNNKKFQYTIVSDDVTKITLKNEVQTLSLSTTSAVVNLREGDSEIVLQFKCDKGSIKPGYKVKYSLEYTGEFKNDQGLQKYFKIEERTAEIDKDLKVRIKPAVDPTAKRDAKLMNIKTPIECAVIRLEPVPGMENDYKNVEFKNAECVISLENKTHRTVKINYVK